jgi:CPA2 family monovalent cation:H+ antiporter-2
LVYTGESLAKFLRQVSLAPPKVQINRSASCESEFDAAYESKLMTPSFNLESYREALLFLGTAGVVVPLFNRLHVSPVLGFLLAGATLGPFGLGHLAKDAPWLATFTLTDVEGVAKVAEIGLAFLLFMIGLELSFERLLRMRRLVFGLGLLQMVVSAAVLSTIGIYWFGLETSPAIIIGAALAMSSTAIVIPVLVERRRLNRVVGRAVFSVLLLQDLLVAPLLLLVSALANTKNGLKGSDALLAFLPGLAGLLALILVGRLLLRPLFRMVAKQSIEVFMAACLLVIVGSAVMSAAVGFSMALGAFIAGLLLGETEFRREIEVTIDPFRGLLLGLFFMSIGAGLDIDRLASAPLPIFLKAAGLIAVKAAIIAVLGVWFRLPSPVAREAALLLAPGGEFAFVLLTSAIAAGVLPIDQGDAAMIVVTLSMFAIPLLGAIGARLAPPPGRRELELEYAHLAPEAEVAAGRVLIVGYGRVGALVGEMLKRHSVPYIAMESDAAIVAARRDEGVEIYWGNATRRDFLLRCGVAQALALVVTVEKHNATEEIVRLAHAERADLTIVARAIDARHATQLYELGATDAIPETIEASLQLDETVLVDVGVPMGFVIASIHEKRDEYRKLLQPKGEAARQRQELRSIVRSRELARRRAVARREPREGNEN